MTNYTIILNKITGETQTQWSSESHEEIMKLWEEEKNEQDKFSKIDMELVLYKDDKVIDDYEIIDAQREWIVID
jgi:hypothetical protein